MRTHIVLGVEASEISQVSEVFSSACGSQGEARDSQYLGEYDLFLLPEKVRVKYNHVAPFGPEDDPDDEWDYPSAKQYGVLVDVGETDRPEFVEELVAKMGMPFSIIKSEGW